MALPADAHQVDETGYIWSVLEEASDADRIAEGRVIVAGDPDEPFLARVIDIVDGADGPTSSTSRWSAFPVR